MRRRCNYIHLSTYGTRFAHRHETHSRYITHARMLRYRYFLYSSNTYRIRICVSNVRVPIRAPAFASVYFRRKRCINTTMWRARSRDPHPVHNLRRVQFNCEMHYHKFNSSRFSAAAVSAGRAPHEHELINWNARCERTARSRWRYYTKYVQLPAYITQWAEHNIYVWMWIW